MTRILVVHRSPLERDRISRLLGEEAGLEVCAAVRDLSAAYHISEHVRPDVALVADDLAALPEFEVMILLFGGLRMRWAILSGGSAPLRERAWPSGTEILARDEIADWCANPHRRHLPPRPGPSPAESRTGAPWQGAAPLDQKLILIGASTGGVDALIQVLKHFTADCPPTLIVQHTGGSFTSGLARLLDNNVPPSVKEAVDGAPLCRGEVRLAPGSERHLTLTGRAQPKIALVDGMAISGHRPSVDALFQSAVPFARRVSACILTGMGRDGAEGLLALRKAGACTVGQDEASSTVYGMPRVAFEIGAVARQLPLSAIGPALLEIRSRSAA